MQIVYFISATQGWAVGDLGIVLTTTDGGANWTTQTSGVTDVLTSIHFVSSTQGWIVGVNGTILTTIDGGTNWTAQTSGTTNTLISVHFASTTHGWAVGNAGTILTTSNGGANWTAQTSGTTNTLNSVYFFSPTHGRIVGTLGTNLITTDGGANWIPQTSGSNTALNSIYFASNTQGWAVGSTGTIFATTNGGTNWTTQTSSTVNTLTSVYFASTTHGWAVGSNGTIVATTNGGTNWATQTSGVAATLNSVYFTSTTRGWAVGISGIIRTTTNGGTNWTAQTSGTTNALQSVFFISATQGWAVGLNGTILTTTNGGANWVAQTSGTINTLQTVFFISPTRGWIAGANGTILTTVNGGANWTAQTSGTTNLLNSVYFASTAQGWAVGFNGTILSTTDGGANWTGGNLFLGLSANEIYGYGNNIYTTGQSETITRLTIANIATHYRTTGNANFASPTNWESSPNDYTWNTATSAPNATYYTLAMTVRNGHTATIGADVSLDEITVESGGILQVNTGAVLTLADGTGIDLTIQNGGLLDAQGTLAGAGSFTLDTGGTFRTSNVNGFNAIGLTGTETFTTGANYEFNGSALQTINNPTSLSANNITVNNSASVTLSNNITITGTLTLINGDLDLNGKNIDLGAVGILNEDRVNNHLVKDGTATNDYNKGGAILFTETITSATSEIRGTGLYLRSGGASYAVTVSRYHYNGAAASRGGYGIKRIYAILGTPVSSTMRIYYASDETAGVAVPYKLYRWTSSTGWENGTASTAFDDGTNGVDYAEAINVTAFSTWTVGSQTQPLPISLVRFTGERVNEGTGEATEEIKLEWTTAQEINNKGFEIEVSENGLAYEKIAFMEGVGSSNTPKHYTLNTINPNDGYYRLKQVDFDGKFSYSLVVFVEGVAGKVMVYPNPNNGSFSISVGKSKLDLPARLLNTTGKEVWRGTETEVHTTSLPAGIYFLHTTVAGKTKVTKVVVER